MSAEELARRHQARLDRLKKAQGFPWKSLLIGVACALLILFVVGVNLISLFIVAAMAAALTASRKSGKGFPF